MFFTAGNDYNRGVASKLIEANPLAATIRWASQIENIGEERGVIELEVNDFFDLGILSQVFWNNPTDLRLRIICYPPECDYTAED